MELVNKDLVKRLHHSMRMVFARFGSSMPSFDLLPEDGTLEDIDAFLQNCRIAARKNQFDGIILNYLASYLEKDLTLYELVVGMEHALRPLQGRKPVRRAGGLRAWINT